MSRTRARPARRPWLDALKRLRSTALALIASSAFAGLLMPAPGAQGHAAANLSLEVTFFLNGTISVTLPNGTPVGSTSGAPTVIPAGFYTVDQFGFSKPVDEGLPYFHLTGPTVDLLTNMRNGAAEALTDNVYFLPNSTFHWTDDAFPGVVHTFMTSADVEGTAPGPLASTGDGTARSQDIVGSAIVPARGTLTGVVNAAGKPTLAYKGKNVTTLKTGRYTIAVTDRSAKSGFMLEKTKHAAVSLTGGTFVGKRSVKVNLTVGRWSFTLQPSGKKTYFVVVTTS